ncbi:DeoR/GlpR transcriptional regulator [Nocardioides bruguierae]|uniref:DeoR/GlpR transcriptional regulator n=1 Tax=Nocardioides bruguierae TaxID=2945102 RepID=A0A9X2IFU4_9ACTN|nr:DeoR/GlpR transcriptional regulator [Nocardioides bruguierae]MCM0620889.1 DeoR/GlpR transcriptional regulator [Nocardioides bruguierae]
MPFSTRYDADQVRKEALGAAAAALVEDHESLVVDNGTTCLAVARSLTGRPLTALALSLHAAAALAAVPGVSVVVPGGAVETDTLAFAGGAALEAVQALHVDVAVLGACSAAPDHGLTSVTFEDARLKRACLAAATRTVLVAGPDKLVTVSTFRFGDPTDVMHLVTTADADPHAVAAYRAAGVEVHLVEVAAGA